MIYDGELYVINEVKGRPDRTRGLAALANIYRALTAIPNPRAVPNIEFILDIEDLADLGEKQEDRIRWSWARRKDNPWYWVMPDFDGWAYPDDGVGGYVDFRDQVKDVEAEYKNGFADKETKLSWRGSLAVNTELREGLVKASKEKSWADVEAIDWRDRSNILAMSDFCRYKYVAHTEGNSWSGRLRYLQHCDSVSIIHDLEYVAHYYPLMKDSGPHQVGHSFPSPHSQPCYLPIPLCSHDTFPMCSLLTGPPSAELRQGQARLVRPRRHDEDAGQGPGQVAAHRRRVDARVPGPVPDAGRRGLLLAQDDAHLEVRHGLRAQEVRDLRQRHPGPARRQLGAVRLPPEAELRARVLPGRRAEVRRRIVGHAPTWVRCPQTR